MGARRPVDRAGRDQLRFLIANELEQLAEQGAELAAGDAAIEAAGLGPEDPIADVGAGIFTAYKIYKIYRVISAIITAISAIEATFRLISKAVTDISDAVDAAVKLFDSPMPSIGSLINDVEKRGFGFERDSGWSPSLGAARIALLPHA